MDNRLGDILLMVGASSANCARKTKSTVFARWPILAVLAAGARLSAAWALAALLAGTIVISSSGQSAQAQAQAGGAGYIRKLLEDPAWCWSEERWIGIKWGSPSEIMHLKASDISYFSQGSVTWENGVPTITRNYTRVSRVHCTLEEFLLAKILAKTNEGWQVGVGVGAQSSSNFVTNNHLVTLCRPSAHPTSLRTPAPASTAAARWAGSP